MSPLSKSPNILKSLNSLTSLYEKLYSLRYRHGVVLAVKFFVCLVDYVYLISNTTPLKQ